MKTPETEEFIIRDCGSPDYFKWLLSSFVALTTFCIGIMLGVNNHGWPSVPFIAYVKTVTPEMRDYCRADANCMDLLPVSDLDLIWHEKYTCDLDAGETAEKCINKFVFLYERKKEEIDLWENRSANIFESNDLLLRELEKNQAHFEMKRNRKSGRERCKHRNYMGTCAVCDNETSTKMFNSMNTILKSSRKIFP